MQNISKPTVELKPSHPVVETVRSIAVEAGYAALSGLGHVVNCLESKFKQPPTGPTEVYDYAALCPDEILPPNER